MIKRFRRAAVCAMICGISFSGVTPLLAITGSNYKGESESPKSSPAITTAQFQQLRTEVLKRAKLQPKKARHMGAIVSAIDIMLAPAKDRHGLVRALPITVDYEFVEGNRIARFSKNGHVLRRHTFAAITPTTDSPRALLSDRPDGSLSPSSAIGSREDCLYEEVLAPCATEQEVEDGIVLAIYLEYEAALADADVVAAEADYYNYCLEYPESYGCSTPLLVPEVPSGGEVLPDDRLPECLLKIASFGAVALGWFGAIGRYYTVLGSGVAATGLAIFSAGSVAVGASAALVIAGGVAVYCVLTLIDDFASSFGLPGLPGALLFEEQRSYLLAR